MGRWSHTEINVPHQELNPDTVTHPSTNRARRYGNFVDVRNAVNAKPSYHASPFTYLLRPGPSNVQLFIVIKSVDIMAFFYCRADFVG